MHGFADVGYFAAKKVADILPKEEVLRIIAHCKDTGLSYKVGCAELGVKIWQFHEAKAYYKRLESDGVSTGEFLQIRADGPMEPASITAFEGPVKERKSRKESIAASTRLQVEISGREGSTMRLGQVVCFIFTIGKVAERCDCIYYVGGFRATLNLNAVCWGGLEALSERKVGVDYI